MEPGWKLREYREGDELDIISLRKVIFGNEEIEKQEIEYWQWEFINNYAGKAEMYLADDNGKIVGHYAVIPCRYYMNGTDAISGSIVVDVMTHPDYRFQGMFAALGSYSLEKAGEVGIDFSLGYPIRDEVLPGHYKVGWENVNSIPIYIYPCDFKSISANFLNNDFLGNIIGTFAKPVFSLVLDRVNRIRKVEKLELKEISAFDKRYDEFCIGIYNEHKIVQDRSSKFLNWRFLSNKFRTYQIIEANISDELNGYIVLRKTEIMGLKSIAIVDLHAKNQDEYITKQLVGRAIYIAKKEKFDLVGMMISDNNNYVKHMKSLGFIKAPYYFKLITHLNTENLSRAELNGYNNIFANWADTDVM